MIKKKSIFSIIILFCIFYISCDTKSKMNKADEPVISLIIGFIEKKNYSDSEIKKFMTKGGELFIEEEMLGFGLKKLSNNMSDENTHFYLDYISYKNEPCKLVIRLEGYEYREIEKDLDKNIKKRFNSFFTKEPTIYPPFYAAESDGSMVLHERDIYKFVLGFPETNKKYSTQKEKLIGPRTVINIPEDLQKYYDFLFSAEEDINYGYYGGIAGSQPTGRSALIELSILNDPNVFINILKGDNPCGRIYAAEGLLRLENSQENVDLINKIISPLVEEKITYNTIDGCIVSTREYEYYTYDETQSFPEINMGYPEFSGDSDLVLDLDFLLEDKDVELDPNFLDNLEE